MKISKHAKNRMRERTDLNHKERLSLFRKALDNGKSVKQVKNLEVKQYLSGKQKVYSKNAHRLYTMYRLPEELVGKEK